MDENPNNGRDSMLIYRSFYEAIKRLPKAARAEVWEAVFEFGLNFKEIPLDGISHTVFTLIRPQIIANTKRYKNGAKGGPLGAEFGHLGGRPKTPKEPPMGVSENPQDNPQKTPKEPPNKNVNKNKNVNENANQNPLVGGRENLQNEIQAWATVYGSIGNRYKTETAYIEALGMLKAEGWPEKQAIEMLKIAASKDRTFCIATRRKRKDPHTWLSSRDWVRDYEQELKDHNSQENTAKGGRINGKSDTETIIEFNKHTNI